MVEVSDEVRFKNEPRWNPRPLLRTIALPVHQVLETSTTAAGPNQSSDSQRWTSINEMGWGRGRDCQSQRTLMEWLNPRDMEGWVNPHGAWGLESHCNKINYTLD